jgi:hypothetical protein
MLVFEEKDAGDVFVDLSLYHRIILKEDYWYRVNETVLDVFALIRRQKFAHLIEQLNDPNLSEALVDDILFKQES